MPLKLVAPRAGKTPYWSVRGTHCGVYINRSTKFTSEAKAAVVLRRWRDEIERGRLSRPGESTFLDALVSYLKAGGDRRFLGDFDEATGVWSGLAAELGSLPLSAVDQEEIDKAAIKLLPEATPQTRNRQFYTPVSAILKGAGRDFKIRRPKGWRGPKRTDWRTADQAFRILDAADAIAADEAADAVDPRISKLRRASHRKSAAIFAELSVFLELMLYTGMRLSEELSIFCQRVELAEATLYLPDTKNGEGRAVYLPPAAVAALARLPRGLDRPGQRVFRLRKSGRLYAMLKQVLERAGPDTLGKGNAFHILRHTWATWMRRYAGLDTSGLVATNAWRDRASAARYEHTTVGEESRKADLLPVRPTPAARKRA